MGNCVCLSGHDKLLTVLSRCLKTLGIRRKRMSVYELTNRIGHVSSILHDNCILVWGGYSKENDHWYYHPDQVAIYDSLLDFSDSFVTQGKTANSF